MISQHWSAQSPGGQNQKLCRKTGHSKLPRNVGKHLLNYLVSNHRRLESSTISIRCDGIKSQIHPRFGATFNFCNDSCLR